MIFPLTSNLIRQDPLDPGNRIDREIADRSYRLAIGLSLENDLETIRGVLTVSQGHGKYLRLRHVVPKCADVPGIVSQSIRRVVDASKPGVLDLVAASSDLARCQAELVEELKTHAGKYVDRLLIVSSVDPGLWVCDEGGRRVFRGLGDPEVLSELCGITVIDSFPGRDLAAGGTGRGLGTLPAWILLADRATSVAGRDGMVFSIADWAQSCFLPASDGLDAELPEARWTSGPGINLLRAIMQNAGRPITADQIVRLSVDGQTNSQLLEAMKTDLQYRDDSELDSESGYSKRIASLPDRLGVLSRYRLADVFRTAIVYIVDNISDPDYRTRHPIGKQCPDLCRQSGNDRGSDGQSVSAAMAKSRGQPISGTWHRGRFFQYDCFCDSRPDVCRSDAGQHSLDHRCRKSKNPWTHHAGDSSQLASVVT